MHTEEVVGPVRAVAMGVMFLEIPLTTCLSLKALPLLTDIKLLIVLKREKKKKINVGIRGLL